MKRILSNLFSPVILSALTSNVMAQNPIIQTKYTADPAPVVINDTVFLYTSHDEDNADGFLMKDWLLYTSTDMVNWTDQGAVASLNDFSWAPHDNGAWAVQVVERNGKYYMYCPVQGHGIGVLVADSPYGPFKDAIGKPLIHQSWDDIDPTVWIDDDGQAYLYWGNPDLYYVRLNEDMISYKDSIVKCDVKPTDYQEGPWFYKHNGHYYLAYASTCCPEGIGYAMSDNPLGPWRRQGAIMDHNPKSNGNHPGIIDYKGHSYCFGFSYLMLQRLTRVHHERRSVCLAELKYNADGTIPELAFWDEQTVQPMDTLNPYRRVEAETMAWGEGVRTAGNRAKGIWLDSLSEGDWTKVRSVDLGRGTRHLTVNAEADVDGCSVELRLDSLHGPSLGVCPIAPSSHAGSFYANRCKLSKAQGVHDVYLVFHRAPGCRTFRVDAWQM